MSLLNLVGFAVKGYLIAPQAAAIGSEVMFAARLIRLGAGVGRRAGSIDDSTRDEMVRRMAERVARRTGGLAQRIEGHKEGDVHVVSAIASGRGGIDYAPFVEFGTDPHALNASRRSRGGRRGMHPGSAPQPFFWPVVSEVLAERAARMGDVFDDAAADAGFE